MASSVNIVLFYLQTTEPYAQMISTLSAAIVIYDTLCNLIRLYYKKKSTKDIREAGMIGESNLGAGVDECDLGARVSGYGVGAGVGECGVGAKEGGYGLGAGVSGCGVGAGVDGCGVGAGVGGCCVSAG